MFVCRRTWKYYSGTQVQTFRIEDIYIKATDGKDRLHEITITTLIFLQHLTQ